MSTHTVTQVGQSRPWQGQNNSSFVDYPLRLAGVEKVAVLTQKPESAAPQPGDTLDLDLLPHPKFDDKLKAKRVQQQGGGGRSKSPEQLAQELLISRETRSSIEAQVALKEAVTYCLGVGKEGVTSEVIVTVAKTFFDGLRGMQA